MVRRLSKLAREDQAMPCGVLVDGEFAGQVTVSNIVRGSAQFASLGYWLARRFAGRGVIPLSVALVIDYCFGVAGLPRLAISVRPAKPNYQRVVEKLGLGQVSTRPRLLRPHGPWRATP